MREEKILFDLGQTYMKCFFSILNGQRNKFYFHKITTKVIYYISGEAYFYFAPIVAIPHILGLISPCREACKGYILKGWPQLKVLLDVKHDKYQ